MISTFTDFKYNIASFILFTLAIGILKTPPDEVFTTSARQSRESYQEYQTFLKHVLENF